jgi:hypothetical protein
MVCLFFAGQLILHVLNFSVLAIKAKHHLRYKSFPPLEPYANGALPPGALELRELERLLAAHDWQTARQKAQHLIDITLEGLGYLQR